MEIRRLIMLGIAPIAIGASLLASCGGDDDGGGGSGSDEDYVATICSAGKKFQEDLFAAFGDIDLEASEEDQVKAFAEPFEDFAKAIEKAKPPSDLKDWHSDAVAEIKKIANQVKDGNLDALESEEDPLGDPPPAVAERLQKVADENQDCQDADFTFGE